MLTHFTEVHITSDVPDQALVDGQSEPKEPPAREDPMPEPEPTLDDVTTSEPPPVLLDNVSDWSTGAPLEMLISSLVDIRDHLRKLRAEDTRLVDMIAKAVGKPGDYDSGGIAFTVSTSRRRTDWQGRDIVERLAGFLADELSVDPESGEVLPPGALVAAVVDVVADVGGLYRPSHGWPTKKLAEHGISADSYSTQGEPKPAVRLLGESGQEPW
jgi:hypothetical protein